MTSRLVFFWVVLFLFGSCSVQNQISRKASKVLSDSTLKSAHIGISIYEPGSGKYLYNYQAEKYFIPASNTKIPTCYVAMKYLGDSLIGLRYITDSDSLLIAWETGDPTFLHPDFPYQPVAAFLRQKPGLSIGISNFSDYLGSGWAWNDYKEYYMAQRSAFPIYGNVVRISWIDSQKVNFVPGFFQKESFVAEKMNKGFDVIKTWDENKFYLRNGGNLFKEVPFRPNSVTLTNLLADTLGIKVYRHLNSPPPYTREIKSQPTDSLLILMMHRSDNFFAEQCLLMSSNEFLGVMDDRSIIDTILKRDFSDLPQRPRWVDGSGLSRYNLFSPLDFVVILDKMRKEFGMERIKRIFPTGGEGTIRNYFKNEAGYIYGKTGTLSGVVAFSGFLISRKGKLLIFSTLVNNHHTSATDVRKLIEGFLRKVREIN